MPDSVKNVKTKDTLRDISDQINAHSRRPIVLTALFIAEANLHELAFRERTWPDVSYGLGQPAVKWLQIDGLEKAPDGTNLDTRDNRRLAKQWCWQAANMITYCAPRIDALVDRWINPLEALCRYNKPSLTRHENPNAANYQRGLNEAAEYTQAEPDEEEPVPTFAVGPGVLEAMARKNDVAMGDERYWSEQWSLTPGRDFAYAYSKESNTTYAFPKA